MPIGQAADAGTSSSKKMLTIACYLATICYVSYAEIFAPADFEMSQSRLKS